MQAYFAGEKTEDALAAGDIVSDTILHHRAWLESKFKPR